MASKPVIFDSNVWIGYFDISDTLHKEARRTLDAYKYSQIFVPEYILLETATVLKNNVDFALAQETIDLLLNTESFSFLPSGQYFTDALKLFLSTQHPNLSFVDVSLLALSKNYEVVTFDKKLAAAIKKLKSL